MAGNRTERDVGTGLSSAPIRCLIVVPSLIRAGAETQAVDLANGLAARGHAVHLCSFEKQIDQRGRLSDAVTYHHMLRRSKYDVSLVARLAELMDRESIDVVQGVLQFATLIAWLASRRSGRRPPVVAGVHTTINRGLKQEVQDRIIYRRMLQRLPAVIFVCRHQRDHWIRKYPELQRLATVVYNGVEPQRFCQQEFLAVAGQLRAELEVPEGAFVLSCIAAFRPEKGHKLLLDAFAQVDPVPFLVFAGDGALRGEVQRYARSLGLERRTRFLGNIPDTRPLVAASNATVLASTAVETFSMAMLESMAMGVPMIAPRIGGLPEAIVHGETGLLFPVGNVRLLADCIQSLVNSPSEAARMGIAAESKVKSEFTLAEMIFGTERVLKGACEPGKPGGHRARSGTS